MTGETPKTERRGNLRKELIFKIEYPTAEDFLADYTHDLSDSGVFVATSKPFSIGEQLTFDISFPGLLTPIRCRGEVRWRRTPEQETDDEPAGIGVTFIFSSEAEAEKLKSLLAVLEKPAGPEAHPEATRVPFRVLLADDSAQIREMFRYAVKSFHRGRLESLRRLEVIEADNGNTAWELLQEGTYDLAIIDYYMPIMNGADLIRRLRGGGKHATLPVIVVSTGSEEICREVYSAGADLFIRKPVLHNQLLKSLELLLDLKQRQG